MSELRTCRTCGETKPLTLEHWYGWQGSSGYYFRPQCRPCRNRYQSERLAQRRAAHGSRVPTAVRTGGSVYCDDSPPIPTSDPWLDLLVVEACWQSCVDEGPPAIRRMVTKIATVTKNLHGAERLRLSATAYLNGELSLELVRTRLEELVGLAVAS